MSDKIINLQLPKWLNSERTVEQMVVRIAIAILGYQCVLA
tara:strand:+ start:265 stop:384 length:120 start_codon:yes stop_codon:yes gene_type:complete